MRFNDDCIGVVLLGDHVQALGLVRSFGRRGIPTYLLHSEDLCIGRFSRYLSKFIKIPDVNKESNFVSFLIDIAEKYDLKGWTLLPTNDTMVRILSKNKKILEEVYKVPTPEWGVTKFAVDKTLTYMLAEQIGISVPKTISINTIQDVEDLQSLDVLYPAILKGVDGSNFYKKTGAKAFKADSDVELKIIMDNVFRLINPSETFIQELIPGNTDSMYSFCSFFKNGRAIGVWTGRKIREHPMGLGTATFAESVYVPEIIELGSKFLSAMDYYGISEVEFKKDPRDGNFKLIEMNARTWLWISLAERAGVNLPYMLYDDMAGRKVVPVRMFEENMKWFHLYTDAWTALKEMLRRRLQMKDYATSLKGKIVFAVFSMDDPVPFIAETLMLPYLWIKR